jgi:hypothetical protein
VGGPRCELEVENRKEKKRHFTAAVKPANGSRGVETEYLCSCAAPVGVPICER